MDIEKLRDMTPEQLESIINEYSSLWHEIENFYVSNLELGDPREYHVIVAFTIATYFAEYFPTYPYIHFYGQSKSGKTRGQETMSKLCFNSIFTVNCSIPALFRMIKENNEYHAIFFDEFSIPIKTTHEKDNEFLQILNCGYKKGAVVIRCEKNGESEDGFVNRGFQVDGFKVLAGTEKVPRTLQGRCIIIDMHKTRKFFLIRIDNDVASKLQEKIFAFVFAVKRLEKKEYYTITEEIQKKLHETSGFDLRIVELFSPLYVIAPEEIKSTILEYVYDVGEAEIEEELASWECEIFQALLDVPVTNSWFSVKDLTEIINKDRSEKEKVRTYSVGRQLRQFGFKPFSKGEKGRGWKWDSQIIDKLKERFPTAKTKQQRLVKTLNFNDKIDTVYELFMDRSMTFDFEQIQKQFPEIEKQELDKIVKTLLQGCKIFEPNNDGRYAKV